MALPRKRRKRRLTLPEYVGVALLAVSLGCGALWWIENTKSSWPRARARLVGLSRSGVLDADPQIAFSYRYAVNGTQYSGVWQGAKAATPVLHLLPKELLGLLDTRTVVRLDDILDDPSVAATSTEGLDTSAIPEHVKDELRERGYGSQEALQEKIRSGDFARDLVAVQARMLAPAASDAPSPAPVAAASAGASQQEGYSVSVRYQPTRPWRSVLDYPGFELRLPYMILSGTMILCTLLYFSMVYPLWKRRGY